MRSIDNYFASRNRRFFGARCLIVILLIGALITPMASNTGSAQSPKIEPRKPENPIVQRAKAARLAKLQADSDKPHTLAASYYSLRDNLKAAVMLNNKGPKPLEVIPSLVNLYGDRFDVPSVTVEANSFREVDLSQWAKLAGPMFDEGSLRIFYKGPDLLLGAQVRLTDTRFSLMFDEQLVEPAAMFKSSGLEGVWWMPVKHCWMNLVLSNTTDEGLSVAVALAGKGFEHRDAVRLTLHPRETRIIDVKQELAGKVGALPEAGGISIQHSGAAGALLARGMISDTASGYSSEVRFTDPANAKSSRLHGAGLRLGRVEGEDLTPVIIARNIGGADSTVTGRIPYTRSDGSADAMPLNRVKLGPGEVRMLSLNDRMMRPQREGIASAGLELEYDTIPGSVVVTALSVSRNRDQVFWLPMLDPASQQSSSGGYPWRIEEGSSTVVYIKNVTAREQQYHLQLTCEDENGGEAGVYSPGLVTVGAGQTVAIDIGRLRDGEVADEAGRLIGKAVGRGQVMWSARGKETLTLIGRAEQSDLTKALSSSYACQNCCQNSFYNGWSDPQTVDGMPGDTTQFTASQQDQNCFGGLVASYVVIANWSSSDESVAMIDSGDGVATAAGPGVTDIFAGWWVVSWLLLEGFPECIESEDYYSTSALCQVQEPTYFKATSVTPASWGGSCSGTVYAAKVVYKVYDQTGTNQIQRAGMTALELVTVVDSAGNVISQSTDYASFSTPQQTGADGIVNDIPIGTCFSTSPPPNICVNVTQLFRIVVPNTGTSGSTTFEIKTTTIRRDCQQGIRVTILNLGMPDQSFTLGTVD